MEINVVEMAVFDVRGQEVQAPAMAIADFLDILIEDARRLGADDILGDLDRMLAACGTVENLSSPTADTPGRPACRRVRCRTCRSV